MSILYFQAQTNSLGGTIAAAANLPFENVLINSGGFSIDSSQIITVPNPGVYLVNWSANVANPPTDAQGIYLKPFTLKTGTENISCEVYPYGTYCLAFSSSIIVTATSNEQVYVYSESEIDFKGTSNISIYGLDPSDMVGVTGSTGATGATGAFLLGNGAARPLLFGGTHWTISA